MLGVIWNSQQITVNGEGNVVAVGLFYIVPGVPTTVNSGVVYVFYQVGGVWVQNPAAIRGPVVPVNGRNTEFGRFVCLDGMGIKLLVGAPGELAERDSLQTGLVHEYDLGSYRSLAVTKFGLAF